MVENDAGKTESYVVTLLFRSPKRIIDGKEESELYLQ